MHFTPAAPQGVPFTARRISRRTVLKGFASGLAICACAGRVEAKAKKHITYGWNADITAPMTATFHVAVDGDDQADGSAQTPFRSIQRGVAALAQRDGGSLAIGAGTYREQVDLDMLQGRAEAPYRLHRRGADRVIISAADPLTGWRACDARDAQTLGAKVDGLFVAFLDKARLRHGAPIALNLYEGGAWRPMATARADPSDPESSGDPKTYFRGLFGVDGEGRIATITDQRLIGRPPQTMQQVRVLIYHHPNVVSPADIADFDPVTGRITLSEPMHRPERNGAPEHMRYALQNAVTALQPGHWMVRTAPKDQIAVYFRPQTPGARPENIEVSLRPVCIDFGRARFVELFGLEALRASGVVHHEGVCIRHFGGHDQKTEGLRILHCRAGENYSANGRARGSIFLRRTHDTVMHHVTVDHARASSGLALYDSWGADLRYLHIRDVSRSAAVFYGLRDSILAFSLFERTGRDAHSNKFNFYLGSDTVLVYGVRTRQTFGYVTYQMASRIHFAFCEFDADPGVQNRVLVSQNYPAGSGKGAADGSGEPVQGATFFYWNNTLLAPSRQPEPARALLLGPPDNSQHHVIHNNILHGGGVAPVYTKGMAAAQEVRSHNVYTGLSWWQTGQHGWHLGPAERTMAVGGTPGAAGKDMRALIADQIAPAFPRFADWDRDIDGTPIDWMRAPIGARV